MSAFIKTFEVGPQDRPSAPTIAIKDSIDIAGCATTAASRALADAPPAARHAQVVQRLIDAGWRIAGKTNMHELAFGMTGINDVSGTPRQSSGSCAHSRWLFERLCVGRRRRARRRCARHRHRRIGALPGRLLRRHWS